MKKRLAELLDELCEFVSIEISKDDIRPLSSILDDGFIKSSQKRAEIVMKEFDELGLPYKTQKISPREFDEHNIIGTLKGEEKSELIICAHHDRRYLCPGADDNGSGLLSIIYLAHELLEKYKTPKKSIKLISFGAEESDDIVHRRTGLLGSKRYVRYYDTKNTWGVINLDLCGRDKELSMVERDVNGTGIYDLDLAGTIRRVAYPMDIDIGTCYTQASSSDNRPFAEKGIRTVWLTRINPKTNKWTHYHTSKDKPETVNMDYIEQNKDLLMNVIEYFIGN